MNHLFRCARAFQWLQKTKFCIQQNHQHLATVRLRANKLKEIITTATSIRSVFDIPEQTKWLSPFVIYSHSQAFSSTSRKKLDYVASFDKIEEYEQSPHGGAFSDWKTLIGSRDWEDFKNGEKAGSRYRIENLPYNKLCPGLYELGVGRHIDPVHVLPAYLGHSKCVRSRLQDYGRCGGHLWYVNDIGVKIALFEDIFSNQGSILFRWLQMASKTEAEAAEAQLLCAYDYAWNIRNNGRRRHIELLKKLGGCLISRENQSKEERDA